MKENKTIPSKSKTSLLSLLINHYRVLFILGSISIFGSWIVQNFEENDFKSQREELIEKQEAVNRMFDARRVWLESLYTHSAIKNNVVENDEIYFVKAYNYLETSLTTLSLINEIIITDSIERKKTNLDLSTILTKNKKYFKDKNYGQIIQTIDSLHSENKFDLNSKFSQSGQFERKLLRDITNKEKSASNKYLFFYILGTLFIAIDFIILKSKITN
jgi:hypothetical protein